MQALVVDPSKYDFVFQIDDVAFSVSEDLKILGVTLHNKRAFKENISLNLER